MKIYLTMASWLINHEVCERDESIYPAFILLKLGTLADDIRGPEA